MLIVIADTFGDIRRRARVKDFVKSILNSSMMPFLNVREL